MDLTTILCIGFGGLLGSFISELIIKKLKIRDK